MGFTLTFIEYFFTATVLALPILFFFIALIIAIGLLVGRMERWNKFDALYWSFITAFTVGYGDIKPLKRASRLLSLFVALFGIMFTGIIVSITVATAMQSYEKHSSHFKKYEKVEAKSD